ncbi:BrnA antitoxin family protein [Niveispirillum cyanobacteriorum]|uniref:Uncharacterized protein n=1 Tax=Niveispirillum cyanobacteriorum TaxID=1612173 RepID=A0A2K9NIX1_9PROT|nr:BrnA antitoxin family protein [Niveispirillum cyanobacteriorum]AUN33038.1 hypothetical protein C0V82_21750 [Niveispirillum cyanobacteriorum]GGE45971.1 hypothetical protein GCM10011317_00500 [Niveispirillum cyanobacteriorum]
MSSERITRRSLGDRRPTVDWSRVDALTDADIQAGIDADPDAAPVMDAKWLANARLVDPDTKVPVTIRLDRDIVSFFKDHGKGYQTRINQVLRAFVDHERASRRTGN